MRASTAA